jgi:hypothetical protein
MPVDLDAAERIINRPHIIDLREDGWTIMHPPACHPDLFACLVNRAAGQDLAEPPPEAPGRYFCDLDGDGFLAIGEPAGDSQGIDWAALVAELRDARAALQHVHLIAKGAAAESTPRSKARQLAEALLATVDGLVDPPGEVR